MTPRHSPLTELIHAVLDGQASDEESRELEVRLAADPAARAEFEDWKRLFEALDAMPKQHAPEGLVAAVTAALPEAPGASHAASQPFPGRRVLGHTSSGISRLTRSVTMSEQSSRRTFANRKAWLGGGLAVAVAVVVTQVALDFPLSKDVVGTIIPAQRYRAAQNGSEQVQVGTRADQAAPTGTVPEAGRALAKKSAAESALRAERSQAQVAAEKAQAQMLAEKVTAEKVMAEKVMAEKVMAEKVMAEKAMAEKVMAEKAQAQLTADRAQAQATADRSQAQVAADRAHTQMMADKVQAEKMQLEKIQAEKVQAERMRAEKVQAEKVQAERMKADRTTQQ
jgi:anti-sigma factor RsiW